MKSSRPYDLSGKKIIKKLHLHTSGENPIQIHLFLSLYSLLLTSAKSMWVKITGKLNTKFVKLLPTKLQSDHRTEIGIWIAWTQP